MTLESSDFDLSAAWLRRAHADQGAFMAGLATRLQDALPGRVSLERRGIPFIGHRRIGAIRITFDHEQYCLAALPGRLDASRTKVVRGVALRSEPLALTDWLRELANDLGRLSEEAETARSALHDFLLS